MHVTGEGSGLEFRRALRQWEGDLPLILDAFAVTALVAASSYGGSVLVEKQGSSTAWFMRWDVWRDVVTITELQPYLIGGIHEVLKQLGKDESVRAAALHYRQSLLYPSVLVATMHLLRVLEALAGTVKYRPKCPSCGEELTCANCSQLVSWSRTDHEKLEHMLGTPCYTFLLREPGGPQPPHARHLRRSGEARRTGPNP